MSYHQQIKIAIVDDHNLFRKGLIKLIHAINDKRYLVLFEATNGQDMITNLDKKALPDIIIMDVEMPEMGGFETVYWLQTHYPTINILVVSMIESEDAIVRMLKLGVKGYLSKDIEVEDLAAALRAITNKGFYYTDFITGKLIHSLQAASNETTNEGNHVIQSDIWYQLNERERTFIQYACSEMTYEEIATQMNLSPKTIDNYREAVFRKLKVKNRVGLALFAVKHKLVVL